MVHIGCGECLFFFKQKTAYEMLISDWSSDVCSSDLIALADMGDCWSLEQVTDALSILADTALQLASRHLLRQDRKSVVEGKSVSVRVDLGGRRIIKKIRNKRVVHESINSHVQMISNRLNSRRRLNKCETIRKK